MLFGIICDDEMWEQTFTSIEAVKQFLEECADYDDFDYHDYYICEIKAIIEAYTPPQQIKYREIKSN